MPKTSVFKFLCKKNQPPKPPFCKQVAQIFKNLIKKNPIIRHHFQPAHNNAPHHRSQSPCVMSQWVQDPELISQPGHMLYQCRFPCRNECKRMHMISVLHLNVHTKGSRELEIRRSTECKPTRVVLLSPLQMISRHLSVATKASSFYICRPPPFLSSLPRCLSHINHYWQSMSSLSKSFKWPP